MRERAVDLGVRPGREQRRDEERERDRTREARGRGRGRHLAVTLARLEDCDEAKTRSRRGVKEKKEENNNGEGKTRFLEVGRHLTSAACVFGLS